MTAPQILMARVVAEVGPDGRDGRLSAPVETPLKTRLQIHVGPSCTCVRGQVTVTVLSRWPYPAEEHEGLVAPTHADANKPRGLTLRQPGDRL